MEASVRQLYDKMLEDHNLSAGAKGLFGTAIMCFCLHYPIPINRLYKMSSDSIDEVDNIIAELEQKGYVSRYDDHFLFVL